MSDTKNVVDGKNAIHVDCAMTFLNEENWSEFARPSINPEAPEIGLRDLRMVANIFRDIMIKNVATNGMDHVPNGIFAFHHDSTDTAVNIDGVLHDGVANKMALTALGEELVEGLFEAGEGALVGFSNMLMDVNHSDMLIDGIRKTVGKPVNGVVLMFGAEMTRSLFESSMDQATGIQQISNAGDEVMDVGLIQIFTPTHGLLVYGRITSEEGEPIQFGDWNAVLGQLVNSSTEIEPLMHGHAGATLH